MSMASVRNRERLLTFFLAKYPNWSDCWTKYRINGEWQQTKNLPDTSCQGANDNVNTCACNYLDLVIISGLAASLKNDLAALCTAREMASKWLESFFSQSLTDSCQCAEELVAKRFITLFFIRLLGEQYSFDARFMGRLKLAIDRQVKQLKSESYHKHRNDSYRRDEDLLDLALLLAACIDQDLPG